MPLWLDLLRTPMAAPETPALRRMRFTWQALCLTCALVVGLFSPLRHAIGRVAPIGAALILFATAAHTCLYLLRKQRADRAFLESVGGGE
ncbi:MULTISPECIES: hypothetical protein [unclassified Sphingobium]|jgi:4-amino-4-deoxy-L-arabinose transferase-like glycosyltransferase|uniref:hypothetical protein n=1 Tax=unclassified Sphingobium TaxID=2611147 RepID=UPI000B49996D|nr:MULTISPECIES: hypothetical protein [unclassified Sphingobium]GLI99451.1 hypothetical protein Sbs19_32690 [Sphingobium sp. BS19]